MSKQDSLSLKPLRPKPNLHTKPFLAEMELKDASLEQIVRSTKEEFKGYPKVTLDHILRIAEHRFDILKDDGWQDSPRSH